MPLVIIWSVTRDGRAYFSGTTMASVESVLAEAARDDHPMGWVRMPLC